MKSIKLLLHFFRLQIRSQLQYPVSFILEVLSGVIIMGFYFVAFALTFARFDNIGGWSLGEVAFVWGLAEFSFGIMDMVFSGFDYDVFGPMIRKGQFDQLLLRPANITLQVFGSRFVLRRLGKMIEGLIIFIYSLTLLRVEWTALKLIYLPVLVVSQVFSSVAFRHRRNHHLWTMERWKSSIFLYGAMKSCPTPCTSSPSHRMLSPMSSGHLLSYYPAVFILGNRSLGAPAFVSFLAPVASAMMFLLAIRFWHFGIRNYQSSGS